MLSVKHKMVTGRTMALYCWCLLLAVLVTDALPITSKPLDNNPDHLTWEAAWLSEDNRSSVPLGGKSKKITPKSIFITPFLNNYNTSACPPDYKVDYNGKCIQVVSINTADILVTKLQSLFSQHGDGGSNGPGTGEDDYDYDYDSTGPFHVNLPLSIDLPPDPPQQPVSQATPNLTYKDIPEPSFYDSAMVEIATVDQDKAKITTVSVFDSEKPSSVMPFLPASTSSTSEPAKVDQSHAESTHTDISFLAFETLPNGTLVGQVELEGKNSTMVQSIIVSSTTTDVPMADSGSTAESTIIKLDSRAGTTTDPVADTTFTDGDAIASTVLLTQDVLTTMAMQEDDSGSNSTEKEVDDAIIATDVTNIGATSTTEQNESDVERMNLELKEELLLIDSNRSSLAPLDPSDVSEMDPNTFPTVQPLPSDEQTVVIKDPKLITLKTTVSPPLRPYVAIPTKPSVQIITPIKGSWDLGIKGGSAHLIAASHLNQQDRTTRATPETTTPTINAERSTEVTTILIARQESQEDTKNSEKVNHLEAHQPLRGLYPGNINFAYHNLPESTNASTTEVSEFTVEPETTTTNSFLQVRPLASTPPSSSNINYLEQLRKINEIVAEKRRHQQQQELHLGASSSTSNIRFPSQDDEQMYSAASNNYQTNGVRFPGTATNRLPASNSNRLPDIFPKKSPDSTTQRPVFWWLPSGWEVDQTGNKPMLLRFWSRMPLVRDSALQPTSASPTETVKPDRIDTDAETNNNRWRSATGFQQHQPITGTSHSVATARGNSKSPSENFYKEVSAQEVYKVMNARQLNHHHQR
ncbi:protein folded gastrulation [Anopheles funestus]|uniref:protein folded gastrulation n=1 Tax=Anopheles funestus TaxID=62324 RepID=UPI0020C70750|nr:protein folded gastrulation [Anopheles funestus]XP_049292033.1 protein folded gastrulation [Anopheles funestus]